MSIQRTYAEYMKEILPDELYFKFLGHGLFMEKLPPMFSALLFFEYSQTLSNPPPSKPESYIYYESLREINIPRQLAIPNPFAYMNLCRCLQKNWNNLTDYFNDKTNNQSHKVSRIHIRRIYNKLCLFEMNYKNWRIDSDPVPDIMIGKRYQVVADISNCFPSIYTHALSWALVGKDTAKATQNDRKKWYNILDKMTRNLKYGETHGLLIGPHASNLLSEIVLTAIDHDLCDHWSYIRNIDDYSCYVNTYEDAQRFLVELNEKLRLYDLSLNHKKTAITELPLAAAEHWIRQLNASLVSLGGSKFNYKATQAFMDHAIELMHSNNMKSSILNYALKALCGQDLNFNAQDYLVKTMLHLASIFPYLVSLMDKYVFQKFSVDTTLIRKFANSLFIDNTRALNFEAVVFAIYFALKYGFELENINVNDVLKSKHCIYSILAYMYFSQNHDANSCDILRDYAKELLKNKTDFGQNWLFIYEVLEESDLPDEWQVMKKAGVSFLDYSCLKRVKDDR